MKHLLDADSLREPSAVPDFSIVALSTIRIDDRLGKRVGLVGHGDDDFVRDKIDIFIVVTHSRVAQGNLLGPDPDLPPHRWCRPVASGIRSNRKKTGKERCRALRAKAVRRPDFASGSRNWRDGNAQRAAELAKALHIRHSTGGNLLDKCEPRGLVRWERSTRDNRVVRLHLTESAVDVVTVIPGPMQGRLRHRLREIPVPVLE